MRRAGAFGDDFADADDRQTVRRVLATVPARQRAALVLTEMLGFTAGEAGDVLGVKASTVRALSHIFVLPVDMILSLERAIGTVACCSLSGIGKSE